MVKKAAAPVAKGKAQDNKLSKKLKKQLSSPEDSD
jgi:hypothetical protein